MTTRTRTAAASFATRDEAERAVDRLHAAGFNVDNVGWTMRGEHEGTGSEKTEGAATGAGAGAAVGGVLGAAGAAVAMALIPGVGPFLAGGYLGTILISAGGAAAAGGLMGGLTAAGMDEDEAAHYDTQFREGRAVVTVNAGERYAEAVEILCDSGGDTYQAASGPSAASRTVI